MKSLEKLRSVFLLLCFFVCTLTACGPDTSLEENPVGQTAPRSTRAQSSMETSDVFAWCIVPFDSMNRTPQQRIEMLTELGVERYAYDWRKEHLDSMAEEWQLAQEADIKVMAVWMWIDANWDRPGALSDNNERVLATIESTGLQTQLWLGFHANYFEDKTHEQAVAAGREMIGYLAERAEAMGSRVALYNHGDWFGEPDHQIEIIEALQNSETNKKIGLIYNFHHGHPHIEGFASLAKRMKPYLWAVNLNGMRPEGPKILPIGDGSAEVDMVAALIEAGYDGPWGILGHVDDADVRSILQANQRGLQRILSEALKNCKPDSNQ